MMDNTTFPQTITTKLVSTTTTSLAMLTTVPMKVSDMTHTMTSVNQSGHQDQFQSLTQESYLDTLNQEFTNLVLPAISYLAILMVIGIVGNSLVLYIYTYRTQTGTITLYIQALAVFDLLSCCIAMPGEIADMSQNYTFGRNPVCKAFRTVNLFCTMASGLTLVVVAVDRYKRICSPLKQQISPRGARVIVIVSSCVCGVLSLPSAAIHGSRTIPTRLNFVNGTDCSISDQFIDTIIPLAYNSFQMLLFLIGAVILTVLYTFIARAIFRQAHMRKVRRSSIIQPINSKSMRFPVSDQSSNSHSSLEPTSPEQAEMPGYKNKPNLIFTPPSQDNNSSSSFTKYSTIEESDNKENEYSREKMYTKRGPMLKTLNTRLNVCNRLSVEVDLSSNTTASPPETPIDQQFQDNRPLLKITRTVDTKPTIKQHEVQHYHQQKEKCPMVDYIDKCSIEQLNELTISSSSSSSSPSSILTSDNLDNNSECDDEAIMKTAREVTNYFGYSDNDNAITNNTDSHTDLVTSQSNTNQNINSSINTGIISEIPNSSSTCVSNAEKEAVVCNDQISTQNSQELLLDSDVLHQTTGTFIPENKNLIKLQIPGTNGNEESCFNDAVVESQKLRWSMTMVSASQMNNYSNGINDNNNKEDKYPHLVRSHSDLGRGGNKSQQSRPYIRREITSGIDETMSGRYRAASSNKTLEAMKRQRRLSSFKRFPDIKKLTISDPQGTRRTTLMLFLITLTYFLSFLPHLILMIIKATSPTSLSGEGGSMELAHNILLRSYFINSVANPIIYSFCTRDFCSKCPGSRKLKASKQTSIMKS